MPLYFFKFFARLIKLKKLTTLEGSGNNFKISELKLNSLFGLRGQEKHIFFSGKLISFRSINLIKEFPNKLEGGGHPGMIPSISIKFEIGMAFFLFERLKMPPKAAHEQKA